MMAWKHAQTLTNAIKIRRQDRTGGALRVRLLASTEVRIFLVCWIVFALHFATNVQREHYPAFSLVDHGTFQVDEYYGFHSDIFRHTDGHAYINNNVAASVIAAVPLLIFDPALDLLERFEKSRIEREGVPETVYRTQYEQSRMLLQAARENGLSLRFGGATVVTSVFLMAPLSALSAVLMFRILTLRGLAAVRATWLSFLFAFGTPVFFRTGTLSHNMLMMYAGFAAFYLLWIRPGMSFPVSLGRRLAAGFFCGLGLALDYSGAIPLLVFYGYLVISRLSTASLKTSIRESIPFILGCVPPVLFLLYSQWAMFGNPFLPGQYWMPDVTDPPFNWRNPYTKLGFRGITWPSLELYLLNLFSPSYGLYVYGPLLLLALVPTFMYKRDTLILPRRERVLLAVYFALFLTFCAANQYSRVQFTTGFRYLVPLVPLMYLAACDHLVRIPRLWLVLLVVPILLHSWVISMVREPVPESWSRFLAKGLQLPWLNVLRATSPVDHPILSGPLLPIVIVCLGFMSAFLVWRLGGNGELR